LTVEMLRSHLLTRFCYKLVSE